MWTANGNESPARPRHIGRRVRFVVALMGIALVLIIAVVQAAPDVADVGLRLVLMAGAVALAVIGMRIGSSLVRTRHFRQVLRPVHSALTLPDLLPALASERPESYLKITPDRPEGARVVWIKFPESFSGDGQLKERIETRVETKIGMSELSWHWKLAGATPTATARRPIRPPNMVKCTDPVVQAMLADRKESELLFGLTRGGKPVTIDLDGESPHLLIAAGTGGSKSGTTRAATVPIFHGGGVGVFADLKMTSHRWALNVSRTPGGPSSIEYAISVERIHDLLVAAGREADRRRRIVFDWAGDPEDPKLRELVGPRFVFVLEEVNSTMPALVAYWQEVREKGDPKRSPALKALAEFMFMGRTARMHMIMTAQSGSANAVGGPEIRENFAGRVLSNYTKRQWLMLVPEIGYRRPSKNKGRVQICYAGDATETQVIFYTEEEAEALAREGLERFRQSSMSHVPVVPDSGDSRSESAETAPIETDGVPVAELGGGDGEEPVSAELVPGPDGPSWPRSVTLKDAAELLEGISYSSLRKYATSDRDPDFPEPVGKDGKANVYSSVELLEWWANRGGRAAV